MSAPKHTPGSWTLNAEKSSVWKGELILAAITIGRGATEADARLIAAAPELLERLEELLEYSENLRGSGVYNRARAALAKATRSAS
jgi:hypothetical protein